MGIKHEAKLSQIRVGVRAFLQKRLRCITENFHHFSYTATPATLLGYFVFLHRQCTYLHMVWDPLNVCDGCPVTVLYTRHSTVSDYMGLQCIGVYKSRLKKYKSNQSERTNSVVPICSLA